MGPNPRCPAESTQGAAREHADHVGASEGGRRVPRATCTEDDAAMTTCFSGGPGVDIVTTSAEIPTLGSLAINAFVLHGAEPLLVDTGTVADRADFMVALESAIDPRDLR